MHTEYTILKFRPLRRVIRYENKVSLKQPELPEIIYCIKFSFDVRTGKEALGGFRIKNSHSAYILRLIIPRFVKWGPVGMGINIYLFGSHHPQPKFLLLKNNWASRELG